MSLTYLFDPISYFFESKTVDPFTDWLGSFIIHNGIFAPILLLMLEEAGIPLPIPGDVYIAYTGYLISKGSISFLFAFILLLISVLLGSSILYFISFQYGQMIILKFGKYLQIDEKKLLTVEEKFRKYGIWVIIFGRHIPGFRVPITIFSGVSRVSYRTFITGTFISVIFWILFYLLIGEKIGKRISQLLYNNQHYFIFLLIPFCIVASTIIITYVRTHLKKK